MYHWLLDITPFWLKLVGLTWVGLCMIAIFAKLYVSQGRHRRTTLMYDTFAPTGAGFLGHFLLAQPGPDEPEEFPEMHDINSAEKQGFSGGYIMPSEEKDAR